MMSRIGANISASEQALLNQLGEATLWEVRTALCANDTARDATECRNAPGEQTFSSPVISSWNVLQRQQAMFVKILKQMAGVGE